MTAIEADDNEAASSDDDNDEFPEGLEEVHSNNIDDKGMDIDQENVPVKNPNGALNCFIIPHSLDEKIILQHTSFKTVA